MRTHSNLVIAWLARLLTGYIGFSTANTVASTATATSPMTDCIVTVLHFAWRRDFHHAIPQLSVLFLCRLTKNSIAAPWATRLEIH